MVRDRTARIQVPEIYLPLFDEKCPENVLLYGGRGGGRSYTAAYKVLLYCMTCQPEQTFFVGRQFFDDVENSVGKQIRICAQDLGIKFLEDSKERVLLDGGCEIRFVSLKDELNLRSSPLTTGIWFEESQQAQSTITIANLRATARRVKGKFLFLATMNRQTPNDAMWSYFQRLSAKDKLVIYATVKDNPFATGSVLKEYEQAVEQLQNGDLTESEFNLVWLGLPDMDGANTFYKWRFLESSQEDGAEQINPELFVGRVAGVDLSYGGVDYTVYTALDVYSDGKRRVVRSEKWKPITTADTVGRITQFCREDHVLRVGVDAGDGAGITVCQDLTANFPYDGPDDFADRTKVVRYVPGVALKNAVVGGFMAANKRAYDHLALRRDLELGKIFALPVRYAEVMNGIWKTASRDGKFYIESKAENKKHTGKSPDENDSMVIANTMANELLKEYEQSGSAPLYGKNILKKSFGFGRMLTKGKKGLPKWL